MAISATYVSGTQFTVSGDRTAYLRHSLRIQALQGVDGTVEGTVDTSSYSAITELTTCTIEESVLTANLATIKRGATYADPDSSSGNTGAHFHTDWWDGGPMVAAGMTQPQRDILDSLPIPGAGDDNKLIQINNTEDGYELVTLQGTADEITITEVAGTKTLAIAGTFTLDEADVNFDVATGHAHTGADATVVDHGNLGSKGTNTHAQIDTFIGTKAQASGLASLDASSKVAQEPASKAQASGIASLNASSKVVEDPANATATPTASKIPIADGSGKLAAGWGGAASTLATLDGSAKVVEDPANATATPTASKIVMSGGGGTTIDGDWLPAPTLTKKGGVPAITESTTKFLREDGAWADPPGASGGEANTTSNVDNSGSPAGIGLAEAKDVFDLPFKSLDGSQFETSGDHEVKIKDSVLGGSGGPGPDYTPPNIKYKDPDEVTVVPGDYFQKGHRLDGQYQVRSGEYWEVAAAVDVDVDAPGTMIGGDVVSSWYGLWMTSASTFLVLPFIRVDAITWSDPSTVINPADHADGTTANNSFVSAADVFNTYRLMLLSDTAYNGSIYTIADSVDGTPDQILITGDKTAEIAATEWLQMIPPAGTTCLYLGDLGFDSSGNLLAFQKDGCAYTYSPYKEINTQCHATDCANTDLGAGCPPTAREICAVISVNSAGTSAQGIQFIAAWGATSDTELWSMTFSSDATTAANFRKSQMVPIPLQLKSKLRNNSRIDTGAAWIAATAAYVRIFGFKT